MRFSKLLLTAAAGCALAAGAAAQNIDLQQEQGLESLEGTVNALEDEPAPPDAQPEAPPAAEEPSETQSSGAEQPEAEVRPELPVEAPAAAAPTPAADTPSGPAPPLTRAEQAQVQRLSERGRLLVAIARAGMIATQDMLSRVSDPEGAGISGWLAEPEGNGMAVTFYADGEDGPRAVYRANVLGGRVVSRSAHLTGERPALSPVQARMAAARSAASAQEHRPCGGSQFNYLVVPPPSPAAIVEVYQITPPTQRGRFPLGGHFRTSVDGTGNVAQTRGFTNACLNVEAPAPAAGQQPRPIGVTHLLDPMPTEVHVLLAALLGRPLLVATGEPQRIWLVTGERIAEVRP